jgi:hypothetical protein
VLGFQQNERDHSSACEEDSQRERTLRDDWPVVDGGWRYTRAEELPCELVREQRFLGLGVLAKQLWSGRKGMGEERGERRGIGWGRPKEQGQCQDEGWGRLGEQGQCWEGTPI